MPLFTVVFLAALRGLSEVLPISGSGHREVAQLWLDPPAHPGQGGLDALLLLAPLAAITVAIRKRLGTALGEGVRAIARPELFTTSPGAHDAAVLGVTTAVSLLVSTLIRPLVRAWAEVPLAVGLGLLATAFLLASTGLLRGPRRAPRRAAPTAPTSPDERAARPDSPSLAGAALVGLAHGLAVIPGASRIGAALTVLLWLGVAAPRALDLAFLITVPALAIAFLEQVLSGRSFAGLELGVCALGLLVAFLAASVATSALRGALTRGRLTLFALWLLPLGLATLAYARALPQS